MHLLKNRVGSREEEGWTVREVWRQESPGHLVSSGSGWALAAAQAFSRATLGRTLSLLIPLFLLPVFPRCQEASPSVLDRMGKELEKPLRSF